MNSRVSQRLARSQKAVLSRIIVLVVFCAIFLGFGFSLLEAQGAQPLRKPVTKAEKEKAFLQSILDRIERLREQQPPDLKKMAQLYLLLFERYPDTELGKVSAWEAYDLFVKAGLLTDAEASLGRIMSIFQVGDTMKNPHDPSRNVSIRATARLELARLYDKKGDSRTALDIARRVPDQFPGQLVGRFSGTNTYYGKVEAVCVLDAARFAIRGGSPNQAIWMLTDLLRALPREKVGTVWGERFVDVQAGRIGRDAVLAMAASDSKRLAIYQELQEASLSDRARAKILMYRGELYEKGYERTGQVGHMEQAHQAYREVIERYPQVVEPVNAQTTLLSIEALRAIRSLFADKAKDPKRAVAVLSGLAQQYETKQPVVAAYALYYVALVNYRNVNNYRQALADLERLLAKFPDVPAYPISDGEGEKPKLADQVQKAMTKIREKL